MDSGAQTGPGEITRLLALWREGDREALDRLFPLVYAHLRSVARRLLRLSAADQTLRTTALVHEAYLRLVEQNHATPKDRSHFFAVAARAMRHILVDHARRHVADKRGGGAAMLSLDDVDAPTEVDLHEILQVHEALDRLERLEARLVRLVELRFFGGLSVEEIAEVMETSPRTVKRDWQKARAFLYREIRQAGPA